jgi:hypothetical protein
MDDFAPETHHGALVLVLLQDAEATAAEWAALDDWVSEGGRLVIAGAQIPPWIDVEPRFVVPEGDVDPAWVPEELAAQFAPEGRVGQFPVPYVIVPETGALGVDEPDADVLLEREGQPYGVSVEHGLGTVVLFPDDWLFVNASLPVADNAIFLEALLADLGGRVELVDAWAGAGADDPLESIRRTHLTPAVVQLLLLILALYLWRGVRFGRPRDPIPASRRAFVQHATAMGHQYGRARATGHAAAAYAGWVLERLRDRYPIAAGSGLHGLAQQVARRSGRDDTEVMRLLVEAHGAAESRAGVGSPGEDLALVRDLGRLMRELSAN